MTQLEMSEALEGGHDSKSQRQRGGCFLTHRESVGIASVVACALVAVGLLTHYFTDRPVALTSTTAATESWPADDSATAGLMAPLRDVRLPRAVLPRHYNLRLFPVLDPANFTIPGQVDIDVEVVEDATKIVLHSTDIEIDKSSVTVVKMESGRVGRHLHVLSIELDAELDFLTVHLHGEKLSKGSVYRLSIEFVAQLNDQLKGFYRSSYDEDGVKKWMATTQMEPVDARRAFPCFDEPNMKAQFTITVGRHRSMTALSNMPLTSSTPMAEMEDYFWDTFDRSVPMSTYLVAIVVADLSKITAVHDGKWDFGIYSRQSAVNQTRYAEKIGPKILTFFEEYFDIEYPLPKQDMVAIPDFAAGAMENWGLITYREVALLYDEKKSSASNKQTVVSVVAHELAHQWFGNLVTMDWWSDLWLNEGFASYVEYLGAHHAEPELEMFQQIVLSLQNVMIVDALESSHPISVVVRNPDEINEIFDHISYNKGCSIIRMLANFIGEKSFKEGLSYYLKSRKYGNAVQDDLWKAFTDVARSNNVSLPTGVKEIMDTWTLKMGYPVVSVERDYATGSARVTQRRFLSSNTSASTSTSTSVAAPYLWWLPLTYTTDFRTTHSVWMADNQTTLQLDNVSGAGASDWLVFNVDQVGFYRVNYDAENWARIGKQLLDNHSVVSTINRAQVLDDALSLAQSGQLDYNLALNLTRYLANEEAYVPWASALSNLHFIEDMLSRTQFFGLFQKHIRHIVLPLYDRVGFEDQPGESSLTVYKRRNAVTWACNVGYKDCVDHAVRYYAAWMANPEDENAMLSPNLKSQIVCSAIRAGGEAEWNFAFQRYTSTNVAAEKAVLLAAMSCTNQAWLLSRMLEWSINATSGVRKQDAYTIFNHVGSKSLGRFLAYDFLRNHWADIKSYFGAVRPIGKILGAVTASFNTDMDLRSLRDFIQEHKADLTLRSTDQALERVENNVMWMKNNFDSVVGWLERTYANVLA